MNPLAQFIIGLLLLFAMAWLVQKFLHGFLYKHFDQWSGIGFNTSVVAIFAVFIVPVICVIKLNDVWTRNLQEQGIEQARIVQMGFDTLDEAIEKYRVDYDTYPANMVGSAKWINVFDLLERLVDPNGAPYINIPIHGIEHWRSFGYGASNITDGYVLQVCVNNFQNDIFRKYGRHP